MQNDPCKIMFRYNIVFCISLNMKHINMMVSSIVLNILISPLDHIMRHTRKSFCHNDIRVWFLMCPSVCCMCSMYLYLYYYLPLYAVSPAVCGMKLFISLMHRVVLNLHCVNWHILCKDIFMNETVKLLLHSSWCRRRQPEGGLYWLG
jgi:hypothetical protein